MEVPSLWALLLDLLQLLVVIDWQNLAFTSARLTAGSGPEDSDSSSPFGSSTDMVIELE